MRLSPEILISESTIAARVEAMASAIAADTPPGGELSVIALLDGALMFCADLVRRLPMPVRLALVPVTSVDRGGDPRALPIPGDFPIEGADVLVVEDILDTGRTLYALRVHLATLRPRRLRMAVLLDKPARRQVRLVPEYVGFTVPDRWIVGYGLDVDGLYRNLPYISFIE
ncbi:MAG TPA: phosphoribosyltransferase family protein [Candidatus Polarisedimenticolaceae bacterium]|nr:phosphoribosyltransferase family protein [Candidatus Polarisedimenticolaceae bacterium]